MGRPRKELSHSQLYNLAKIHCTMKEIAAVMDCSVDTLENNFSEIIKKGKEVGKTSLRRYIWKSCEKGNVPMLIWMSKQLLGMREPDIEMKEFAKSAFEEYLRVQKESIRKEKKEPEEDLSEKKK